MERKPYPSDINDAEWKIIEPLIPPAKTGGRPRKVNMREIINGIFYVLRSGCAWRMLLSGQTPRDPNPMTFHPDKQSIITSVSGEETEHGNS
jgi:transposase